MGIMPSAGNRYLVFQSSMYSALPTYVIRRGSTAGRKNESSTEVWLAQMIAPPVAGTFSRPRTWNRQPNVNIGLMTLMAMS